MKKSARVDALIDPEWLAKPKERLDHRPHFQPTDRLLFGCQLRQKLHAAVAGLALQNAERQSNDDTSAGIFSMLAAIFYCLDTDFTAPPVNRIYARVELDV